MRVSRNASTFHGGAQLACDDEAGAAAAEEKDEFAPRCSPTRSHPGVVQCETSQIGAYG